MYINCKEKAEKIKNDLKEKISKLDAKPILTVLQVGDNPVSNTYIKGKVKDCKEVGIICNHIKFKEEISEKELAQNIKQLQKRCHGIIVQLPLPKHISKEYIINSIDTMKDVDGFKKDSLFTPCTPLGIMEILKEFDLTAKDVLIINRSNIVGRPLVNLLLDKDATVTIAHSKTKELQRKITLADIVITATGVPNFIKSHNLKKDAIVIDVGINRDNNGKLSGDVDEYCSKNALVTPVPGGIGLMTRAALLMNTYVAFVLQKRGE